MNSKSFNPIRGLVTAIIALIGVMFLNFNLVAQTSSIPVPPPKNLPVYSQDALRSWAMNQVRYGVAEVWAGSLDWDFPGTRVVQAAGKNGEQVLADLARAEFSFRVGNPDDSVQVSAQLRDGNGRALFSGGTKVPVDQFKKGGGPSVQLNIHDVPLIGGVQSAEILVTGEDGVTVRTRHVEVDEGGWMTFPSWMAGVPNGILSVRYKTGEIILYPLSSGAGVTPVGQNGGANFGVLGHSVYQLMGGLNTIQIRAVGERPSFYIEALEDNARFVFDVAGLVYAPGGQYWEKPSGYYVQGPDGQVLGPADLPSGNGFTLQKKGMAVRVFFEWNQFAQPGNLYTGPEDGGKGVIAVTP